jgi:transposase
MSEKGHFRPIRPVFQPADAGFAPKADPRLDEKQIAKTRSASAGILYRARNLVEGFFNKIKQCRQLVKRHDKLAANDLAFVQLASIRPWLRVNKATSPILHYTFTGGVGGGGVTPSFFCRLVDEVVYWNTSRLSG